MMKKILLSSVITMLSCSAFSMQAIDDHSLGEVAGQDGITAKVALNANIDEVYFQTNGNRVTFGNIAIDTDSNSLTNRPITLVMDPINSGFRKGLEIAITDVNSVSATIRDMSLSRADGSNSSIFGSIGIEHINFNGGEGQAYVLGRGAVGQEGLELGLSLPDGTTLDFTINDYEYASSDKNATRISGVGGELRASIEINDFFIGQTVDVVDLGDGEGRALRMTFKDMHGAFDVRNLTAGDGSTYQGSYGRVQIDGMQMNRGYLIVDALPN